MRMPRELIDEAGQRAAALSDVARRVSAVVQQLAAANSQAERNEASLREAASVVDEKLEHLKHHAARVGQLLGIIRQLYGTMDARIGRLRHRLGQADGIFRDVPQELEGLRQALAEDMEISASLEVASGRDLDPLLPEGAGQIRMASGRTHAAEQKPAGRKAVPPRPEAVPTAAPSAPARRGPPPTPQTTALPPGSLGERAARNKKLNEWLREVLGEEGIKAGEQEAPVDRNDRTALPFAPVTK
jgi:hypothetical protein